MTESIAPPSGRPWVEVDLAALVRNAATIARAAGVPLLPMLKADGYGLGAVPVARALEPLDPWGYGVAYPEEAAVLRAAGITRPVLVFTPMSPPMLGACLAVGARPCIGDLDGLEAWLGMGSAPFHLEIDTGMRRAGLPFDDPAVLARARDLLGPAEGWEGVFTHFHSADTDPGSVAQQERRFATAVGLLGRRPPLVHLAASAGAAGLRAGGDLVRPGIYLYGGAAGSMVPEVVARFQAPVVGIRRIAAGDTVSYGASWAADRDTWIATVGAGYADGVHRSLSNRGRLEIAGQVCPIVGRVTMDMTMVALGPRPAALGETATVFGGAISLDVQADAAGTIAYELLTSLGPRVTRRYLERAIS